ncbi:ZPR1 zinc-finger domain-containing protein [Melampsora americana]|nr:ZPR1 zinc-finger domain-containing protein [Melampsora americana]
MAITSEEVPKPENHFPSIGETAEAIQAQDDSVQDDVDQDGDEEHVEGVDSIESLCMECGKNGMTRMLLTSIPFFREVIIVSFKCPHCHSSNNSIQSAGQIQPRGSTYTVKQLCSPADLNRSIIKSEHCVVKLPELELEIPKGKGKMTTVEGLIKDCIDDLSLNQPVRQHTEPIVYQKIETLLGNLQQIIGPDAQPVTVQLEDPSGNSFIEAIGGLSDPKWSKREFNRTAQQNMELGLLPDAAQALPQTTLTDDFEVEKPDEVYSFPSTCTSCGKTLETYMKPISIPHFKEVILMSTNCHSCGYKDNEIKSGGAIAPLGTRLTLNVKDKEDLSRDILKSESASLSLPEIDLHLNPGTLGGRFTTLEGLLNQVYEELDQKVFAKGDSASVTSAADSSAPDANKSNMESFLAKLKQAISAEVPYTVIIDDPLSNSYIQNIYAPDPDPELTKLEYTRTPEQDDELGLSDMKTEDY